MAITANIIWVKKEAEKNLQFILKNTWITENKDAIFAFRIFLQWCSNFFTKKSSKKKVDIKESRQKEYV